MKTFDAILHKINPLGRYQILLFFAVGVWGSFIAAFSGNVMIFAGFPMAEHDCKLPPSLFGSTGDAYNESELRKRVQPDSSGCKLYNLTLAGWRYDGDNLNGSETVGCIFGYQYSDPKFTETYISKFDLVCDRKAEYTNVLTLFYAGNAVGSFLLSPLQDYLGRKPMVVFSSAWVTIVAIGLYLAPSLPFLKAFSFMLGMQGRLSFPLHFLYCQELTDIDHQTHIMIISCIAYGAGCGVVALCSWLATTWRVLLMLTIIVHAVPVIPYLFIQESPRWLLSRGRVERAKPVIRTMIRINKVQMSSEEVFEMEKNIDIQFKQIEDQGACQYAYWALFTNGWSMAGKTLILAYLQTACFLIYMGINVNIENFGVNPYLVFFLVSMCEVPGSLMCSISNYIGRIPCGVIGMVAAGSFALATALILKVPGYSEALAMLCIIATRLGGNLGWCCIYLVNAEIFPTSLRSVAFGLPWMIAVFAAIGIPAIVYKASVDASIPMVIFATLAFIAGGATLLLPESAGTALYETVEDEKEVPMGWAAVQRNVTLHYMRHRNDREREEADHELLRGGIKLN